MKANGQISLGWRQKLILARYLGGYITTMNQGLDKMDYLISQGFSEKEKRTILFIHTQLNILSSMIEQAQNAFTKEGESGVLKKATEMFIYASEIDLDKINISGEKSLEAVNILLEAFKIAQKIYPDEDIEAQQRKLEEKINHQYEFNPLHQDMRQFSDYGSEDEDKTESPTESESDEDTFEDCENVSEVGVEEEKSASEEEEKEFEDCENVSEVGGEEEKSAAEEEEKEEEYFDLVEWNDNETYQTIEDKPVSDETKKRIIEEFKKITDPCRKKIEDISERSKLVKEHEKEKYMSAITEGSLLLIDLDAAIEDFKENGTLNTFRINIQKAFKEFESKQEAFATYRPEGCFREFKKASKCTVTLFNNLLHRNNTTDTAEKFNTLKKDLEQLREEDAQDASNIRSNKK